MTYVCLLRAINVGGSKPVKMDALRKSFEKLKLQNVRTYIASGNVLFETGKADGLEAKIAKQLFKDFGHEIEVLVRTADQLKSVLRRNPFLKRNGIDEKRLFVTFLSTKPTAKVVKEFLATETEADQFEYSGLEVFGYFPNGYGTSKFSGNRLEKILGVVSTTRNWNTVNKLQELADLQ